MPRQVDQQDSQDLRVRPQSLSDCLMPEGLEVNCEVYCTTTIL